MDFICVILQVQGDGAYPLGIDDPTMPLVFYRPPFLEFALCVEIKVGIDGVISSLFP